MTHDLSEKEVQEYETQLYQDLETDSSKLSYADDYKCKCMLLISQRLALLTDAIKELDRNQIRNKGRI